MRKVESSAIQSVSYNPLFVTVKFNHGGKYRYYHVAYRIYKALRDADSVGRAYHELIKGQYNSRKVVA